MKPLNLLWFKRDLRIRDHLPLLESAKRGTTVPIYVFEPSLWSSPEYDPSHFQFVRESLVELDRSLKKIGGRLAIRIGELPEVFQAIAGTHPVASISSHEETGSWITFDRDKRIAKWCREKGIAWNEYPQNGVVRRLANRDGWSTAWARRMAERVVEAPRKVDIPEQFDWGAISEIEQVTSKTGPNDLSLQAGGESKANETLESFLLKRGLDYRTKMSSPVSAETSCSRLSPYIAWGNLSIRQVKQATDQRLLQLQAEPKQTGRGRDSFASSLRSFKSRLSWHCHFIQKLETEPELEFRNTCRAYDGLRETEFNTERFEAWKQGKTGFPMIDACMRYLHHNRWINFRMRAMLMSFAAYHLWLHWREPALFLARHFLDFEPGIHFPQCQMQSGVTGINTLRIYSPSKQLVDQDPRGEFVRRWIPELQDVPFEYLVEPHRMSIDDQIRYHCRIGVDYPPPVVDDKVAVKNAKDRIYAIRRSAEARQAAEEIYLKHGSRKRQFRDPIPGRESSRGTRRSSRSKRSPAGDDESQMKLPGFDES